MISMADPKLWNIATDLAVNSVILDMTVKVPRAKRVRCTCVRCGKVKYEPCGIDLSESSYFCQACDDKFVMWQNVSQPSETDEELVARFLRTNPCRR